MLRVGSGAIPSPRRRSPRGTSIRLYTRLRPAPPIAPRETRSCRIWQRAIDSRQVVMAEMAAREMLWVGLQEALELVVLYALEDLPKFEQAAVR